MYLKDVSHHVSSYGHLSFSGVFFRCPSVFVPSPSFFPHLDFWTSAVFHLAVDLPFPQVHLQFSVFVWKNKRLEGGEKSGKGWLGYLGHWVLDKDGGMDKWKGSKEGQGRLKAG